MVRLTDAQSKAFANQFGAIKQDLESKLAFDPEIYAPQELAIDLCVDNASVQYFLWEMAYPEHVKKETELAKRLHATGFRKLLHSETAQIILEGDELGANRSEGETKIRQAEELWALQSLKVSGKNGRLDIAADDIVAKQEKVDAILLKVWNTDDWTVIQEEVMTWAMENADRETNAGMGRGGTALKIRMMAFLLGKLFRSPTFSISATYWITYILANEKTNFLKFGGSRWGGIAEDKTGENLALLQSAVATVAEMANIEEDEVLSCLEVIEKEQDFVKIRRTKMVMGTENDISRQNRIVLRLLHIQICFQGKQILQSDFMVAVGRHIAPLKHIKKQVGLKARVQEIKVIAKLEYEELVANRPSPTHAEAMRAVNDYNSSHNARHRTPYPIRAWRLFRFKKAIADLVDELKENNGVWVDDDADDAPFSSSFYWPSFANDADDDEAGDAAAEDA